MTRLAFRMGLTAFGGPAAHIAILRHEAVARRKWLTEQEYLDYISLSNLIPGPNSTELIMHVGALKGGRRGLVTAGLAFILPAATITLVIAYAYCRWGTTTSAEGFLSGIAPALIVVIAFAIAPLARATITSSWKVVLVGGLVLLYSLGTNELGLLLAGTLAYLAPRGLAALRDRALVVAFPLFAFLGNGDMPHPGAIRIFLLFLKFGTVLYGSGYVLIAFLQRGLVDQRHWLTQQQLIDAIAVGQMTPGPLFTTSTFVGYLVGGWLGAAAATVGIFLPAFLLVWATHGIVDRVRASASLSHILDGLNLASNALLIGVMVSLARNVDATVMNGLLLITASLALASRRFGPTPVLVVAGLIGSFWGAL